MILKSRSSRVRKGTFVPEFTLIVVVFFMFMFGIFEYARFIFVQNVLNNAAREGARYAVVQTNTASTTTVQNYVNTYLAGQGSSLSGFSSSSNISVFQANTSTGKDNSGGWSNAQQGQAIGVTISGTYTPLLPNFLFMNTSISMQATAIMYSEGGL